jgi:hypothetical protein
MTIQFPSFVKYTGFYNMAIAVITALSAAGPIAGIRFCYPAWALLLAGFLCFTAAVLMFVSRDVKLFAPLIFWEMLLRFAAFAVLVPYGLFGDIGGMASVLGLGDLLIGLGYLYGLRTLGASFVDLLLGRGELVA